MEPMLEGTLSLCCLLNLPDPMDDRSESDTVAQGNLSSQRTSATPRCVGCIFFLFVGFTLPLADLAYGGRLLIYFCRRELQNVFAALPLH